MKIQNQSKKTSINEEPRVQIYERENLSALINKSSCLPEIYSLKLFSSVQVQFYNSKTIYQWYILLHLFAC